MTETHQPPANPLAEPDACCGELHLNKYVKATIPPCDDCPLLTWSAGYKEARAD